MGQLELTFDRCDVEAKVWSKDLVLDEYMKARIFFSMKLDGVSQNGEFHADLKQVAGGGHDDLLEVGPPVDANGRPFSPFNHEFFRRHAEEYFREIVGFAGLRIHIGEPHKKGLPAPPMNVSEGTWTEGCSNTTFRGRKTVVLDIDTSASVW